MQKPTLRFRQVFEHPTHFKVMRPMGNPITIAKNSISPSLQARLRKFAEGDLVSLPTPQDQANLAELEAQGIGVEREKAPDVAAVPAERIIDFTPEPGAEPVPYAGAELEALKKEARASAPDLATQAKYFKSKLAERNAAIDAYAEANKTQEEPVFSPRGQAVITPDLGMEKVGSRITPPASDLLEIPDVSELGKATQATADQSVFSPEEQVKYDQYVKSLNQMGARPQAKELARQFIMDERQKAAAADAEKAKTVEAKEPPAEEEETKEPPKLITEAERRAKQIEDLLEKIPQAEAERIKKEAELTAGARASAELDLARAQGAQQAAWQDFEKAKEEKGSYLSRLSAPRQIGTLFSLVLGSFASGMTGIPNTALKLYEDAVDRDLDRQKRDENSAYNKYLQAGLSVKDAEALVKSTADRAFAADIASAGKDSLNLKAQVEALRVAGNMELQAQKAVAEVMANVARAKEADVRAEELPKQTKLREQEAARKEAKDKEAADAARKAYQLDLDKAREQRRHNLAVEGLSAKEKKIAEDRIDLDYMNALNKWDADAADRKAKQAALTMNINGLPVPTTQEIIARDVPKTVRGMDSFLRLAKEIDDIFAKNPVEAAIKGTDANTAANLKLKELLERYPKSEGYQRPLNVTASRVIDAGLQAPTSVISGVFGKPRVVMKNLIDDLIQNRNELIRTSAATTDEGKIAAQKAIESYGDAMLGSTDAALGARKAP